jgi:pyrroloquinoline quinone (PQQ) biosynthesis protein C
MSYDNTNSGALFINKNKKEEKHPFWQGKLNVEGKEYQLSGWVKDTKTGDKMLSLKLSEPFKKEEELQNTSEKIMNSSGLGF